MDCCTPGGRTIGKEEECIAGELILFDSLSSTVSQADHRNLDQSTDYYIPKAVSNIYLNTYIHVFVYIYRQIERYNIVFINSVFTFWLHVNVISVYPCS